VIQLGLAERVEIVGVCSRSEGRARSLAESLGVPWSLDLEEAAGAWGARGAIVAVTCHSNAELGLRLVKLGLPALLETPLAMNLDEGEALVRAVRSSDIPVEIAEQNPRFPTARFWRHLVEEGLLGKLGVVSSSGAGYRYHATAVARSLFSRREGIAAVGMRSVFDVDLGRGVGAEPMLMGSVEIRGGGLFQLLDGEGLHTGSGPWLKGAWQLYGDRGSIVEGGRVRLWQQGSPSDPPVEHVSSSIDGVRVPQCVRLHGTALLEVSSPLPSAPLDEDGQAVAQCILDWLDRIEGRLSPTAWSASDALADLAWVDAIERSSKLGGARLFVQEDSRGGT